MDIISVLSNPVRMRILQYLIGYGDGTTKQIAEYASNIPKPTLYRHINYLIENGIVIVKEERKVRGSVERLLSADPAKMYNEKEPRLMWIMLWIRKHPQKKFLKNWPDSRKILLVRQCRRPDWVKRKIMEKMMSLKKPLEK